ncbi:Derlin-2 [Psilocybe cubensis]|uniref:Derlin-2 n=2 Tax=Psilocybe cubensis TaxID=181762 RepID=A0ACB8GQI6_PSICU|nr:Derlin-2 [Psilocybe cubensis]KAH9477476.1 Derlin-2 [Psilocybe cubensis]
MDQIIAEIKKIPPVTRFICGSSLVVTLSLILNTVSFYSVAFRWNFIYPKFQLWRLWSSFFVGGGGLMYIFELMMLYRTSNDIETKAYFLRSADYAYQLIWACVAIIFTTWPFSPSIFTRPFLLCLVYVYAALAPPSTMTSIMGLVTVPVIYYPYILIAFDLLSGGPQVAALSVAGAVVGHLWWWTVWGGEMASRGVLSNRARAPRWLCNLMGQTNQAGPPPAAGGTAQSLARGGIYVTAPRQAAEAGNPSGHTWGSGRRLGS